MCLLNHCSVQIEFSDINLPESETVPNLNYKILLQLFLILSLIFFALCFATPDALSQEMTNADLGQNFEEDPLAESDPELSLDEDPLTESDSELGLDEDPLSDSEPELG